MKKIFIYSFMLFFGTFFFMADGTNVKAQSLLKHGSTGQEVYDIQEDLVNMGYLHTSPTGFYGTLTEQAVADLQYDTNLLADGIAGANTIKQMDNIEVIAKVVHGEARGESSEGKMAVAAVILNRVDSAQFPNTIRDVVFQTNAFTAVHDGQYYLTPTQDAYRAAVQALNGYDPTNGSTYYYNPITATDEWIFTRNTTDQIGSHVFAE